MMHVMGLAVIIPISIILTISYFVMFANAKTDVPMIKNFGVLVSVLLWIAAGLVLLGGLYILVTGHHPMEAFMRQIMQGTMQGR